MKSPRGFTLVETVLTLAIVAAGLIGLIYAFGNLSAQSIVIDQTIVATNLAHETRETIIAQRDCNEAGCGYSATLASINTTNTYDANPVPGFPGYAIDTSALEVDPDSDGGTDDFLDAKPGSGYARVTTQVSWNGGANSINVETLITSY
jgi:prepilin-type N-terminal cleavage/methylation domain-containing protein